MLNEKIKISEKIESEIHYFLKTKTKTEDFSIQDIEKLVLKLLLCL